MFNSKYKGDLTGGYIVKLLSVKPNQYCVKSVSVDNGVQKAYVIVISYSGCCFQEEPSQRY